MSAHPVMHQALAAFAPKQSEADSLRQLMRKRQGQWNSLLRLPFEIDVKVRDASFEGPAEYAMVVANEDDVYAAVDWLIDRHMVELAAKVSKLRAERESQS